MKRKEIMQYVPLDSTKTQCINTNINFSFTIDTADLPLVVGHTWGNVEGYVSNCKLGRLHRYLTNAPADMVVDHYNHNPQDNTRGNLRLCKQKENSRNRLRRKRSKSGFKGVSWHKRLKKWQAVITVDGKDKFLGAFPDIETAVLVRDEAERELFGEFACPNFSAELIPA
jgi:hypothetical protein